MNTQGSYLPLSFSLPQMVIVKQLDQHHRLTTLSNCIIANIFHVKKHMLTVNDSCCTNSNDNFKTLSRKKEKNTKPLNSAVLKKKIFFA